ncbi:hypothetical protein ACFFTM_11220 [Pseudoduganella plicata]|uniref:Lipoprotein n=1 Tax=Pseudoduganella plicata TaxID=321984 RepID=A0A4P7BBJ8_9BURK|nr:hypothetical protein [Pseudoduganella plicata]QBQ35986.1 hypothetical protein E1742_07370 [Pseudoduganella plicata]GGY78935.1 hypothetical protein GCM10007388_09900 [Pseudoduganella plicata]
MKTLFAVVVTLGLAGCGHYYAAHDPQACDRMPDWNDRKACKDKMETERTEWEKGRDKRKD